MSKEDVRKILNGTLYENYRIVEYYDSYDTIDYVLEMGGDVITARAKKKNGKWKMII